MNLPHWTLLGLPLKVLAMIIRNQNDVTQSVLQEIDRAPDARFRQLMSAAVQHLHDFARETKLTEAEFHQICTYVARLGQLTSASHNEVVLAAGSLGLSSLVCLLNNGDQGQTDTTANLMGPFWRMNSPVTKNGDSIVRSATPGAPVFVDAWVYDPAGKPVANAEIDVWQASGEGLYENQDPEQADMNLRGKFTTDDQGHIWFRTVKPVGYPIPISGVVGELLRIQGRHNMRPAHIHFMIYKPGYKTQFSQVYSSDDPNIDTDVQFGVTQALVADYTQHENEKAPAPDIAGVWYTLERRFTVEPGEARLPKPPITGKAEGPRPQSAVLERRA